MRRRPWKVPRLWEGSRCIIIGGGPSLIRQFDIPEGIVQAVRARKQPLSAYAPFMSSIHNEHIIGVNMAYQLGDWVDICFFGDFGFWKKQRYELNEFNGLLVTCAKGVAEKIQAKRIKYLEKNRGKDEGITDKNNQISWNKNSGASAINLAIHLGCKQIILIGFDMMLDENKNQHWHKCYTTPLQQVGGSMNRHRRGFSQIKKDAIKLGIEIMNASPDSKIQEFQKGNIWEFLK